MEPILEFTGRIISQYWQEGLVFTSIAGLTGIGGLIVLPVINGRGLNKNEAQGLAIATVLFGAIMAYQGDSIIGNLMQEVNSTIYLKP